VYRSLVLFLGTVGLCTLQAQQSELSIGLFQATPITKAVVVVEEGAYHIYSDGRAVGELTANDGISLHLEAGKVQARTLSHRYEGVTQIELRPKVSHSVFRVRISTANGPERVCTGTLRACKQGSALQLALQVHLEHYVAGVVQAEAGPGHHPEYYKLQAVICRTYALSNLRKHAAEGYHLCDGTHCQVFHGTKVLDGIRQAVSSTHGMVLVDASIRLVHTVFHSNCGGETVNAEDVWSKPEPYLRSVSDPYCTTASKAAWEKRIPLPQWLDYLTKQKAPLTVPAVKRALLDYEPACRGHFLGDCTPWLPLEKVREDWALRSTFFSVHTKGQDVVLRGRGFGHGVGLCQQGAMQRAAAGSSFQDILHHYYAGVHLIDLVSLDFFREDRP
jgi:stage II sporulation protein D